MKSYRQVLQSRVPEGQRTSARTLAQSHGLHGAGLGATLSALIRILEGVPSGRGGGQPPGGGGQPSTLLFLSASLEFTSGQQARILRIGGSGFEPGEKVELRFTTKVGDAQATTDTTQTHPNGEPIIAGSLGQIGFKKDVLCVAGTTTKFKAQAKGLSSSRQSIEAGAEC